MRFRLLAILALSLSLSGCLSRPPGDPTQPYAPFGAMTLYGANDNPLLLPERATYRGGTNALIAAYSKSYDVLALSGGGSFGAFGAGVLKGWTETGTRPTFAVVTGISTGALLAPFAFLGSPHDDDMARLYTETSDEQVYSKLGLGGLFGDGLLDTTPLRTRIFDVITEDILDRIAAEHGKGRRLYVGTTNLDTGEQFVWDMGGVAASGQSNRRRRFVSTLLASAAVPGVFRPVYVGISDGNPPRMHVDGGVKAPILLRDFMLLGNHPKKTVHIIINGGYALRDAAKQVEPNLIGISAKSISELLRSLLHSSVHTIYVMSKNAGARMRMAYLPANVPVPENALHFDPREMQALFEAGRAVGRSQSTWPTRPPRLQRFE